jgi:hypothetical protein
LRKYIYLCINTEEFSAKLQIAKKIRSEHHDNEEEVMAGGPSRSAYIGGKCELSNMKRGCNISKDTT